MTTTTPSAPDEVVLDEKATVAFALQFESGCRDCADANGTCPGTAMPCDPDTRKATATHVVRAINYGLAHGYLRASPQPAGVTDEMVTWAAQALAAVHIAAALPEVAAAYDFDHADDCLRRLWVALRDAPRLPSPTDTRERVLEEAAKVADRLSHIEPAFGGKDEYGLYESGNQRARHIAEAIRAIKSKPTEAPVEDGWVRVPKERTQ